MYELRYDPVIGCVCTIVRSSDNACVPFNDSEFLKWNAEQKTPLNLNSTIKPIPPAPARDLAKEIDKIKADIEKLKVL